MLNTNPNNINPSPTWCSALSKTLLSLRYSVVTTSLDSWVSSCLFRLSCILAISMVRLFTFLVVSSLSSLNSLALTTAASTAVAFSPATAAASACRAW